MQTQQQQRCLPNQTLLKQQAQMQSDQNPLHDSGFQQTEIIMSTIFFTHPPFIVDAGSCPGVYTSLESYHSYLQMKGIEPMAILRGFSSLNQISSYVLFSGEGQMAEWDTKVDVVECVLEDPKAGPSQDAEWYDNSLQMIHDVRDYGNGRNISFGKRSRDVISSNGEEVSAETAESHNL